MHSQVDSRSAPRTRVGIVAMITSGDRLMTFDEFISGLNISARTGRSLVARGLIGTVRIGRVLRVPQSELNRFINERYTPPCANPESLPPSRRAAADDLDVLLDRAVARQKGAK